MKILYQLAYKIFIPFFIQIMFCTSKLPMVVSLYFVEYKYLEIQCKYANFHSVGRNASEKFCVSL